MTERSIRDKAYQRQRGPSRPSSQQGKKLRNGMNTINIEGVKKQRLGGPKRAHVHVGPRTLKAFKQICFTHPSLEEFGKLYGKIAKKNLTSNCLGLWFLYLINIWVEERARVPWLKALLGTKVLCAGVGKMVKGRIEKFLGLPDMRVQRTTVPKPIGEVLMETTIKLREHRKARLI